MRELLRVQGLRVKGLGFRVKGLVSERVWPFGSSNRMLSIDRMLSIQQNALGFRLQASGFRVQD